MKYDLTKYWQKHNEWDEAIQYIKMLEDRETQLKQENNQLKEQLEKKYEKVGTLTTEILYEENTKLQSVLKELRNWLEEGFNYEKGVVAEEYIEAIENVLSKLNDLEGKNDN